MVSVAELAASIEARNAQRAAKAAKVNSPTARAKFRSSLQWRRTRYAVLAENAARNGGVARCDLCGAAAAPNKPLHVDHIEALSKNWQRRLDKTNLQVLCEDCNVGKLDGPPKDFRRPPAA